MVDFPKLDLTQIDRPNNTYIYVLLSLSICVKSVYKNVYLQ